MTGGGGGGCHVITERQRRYSILLLFAASAYARRKRKDGCRRSLFLPLVCIGHCERGRKLGGRRALISDLCSTFPFLRPRCGFRLRAGHVLLASVPEISREAERFPFRTLFSSLSVFLFAPGPPRFVTCRVLFSSEHRPPRDDGGIFVMDQRGIPRSCRASRQ